MPASCSSFHLSVCAQRWRKSTRPSCEVEPGDHAVAVERDVVAQARRKLRIGLHAVEGAVDIGGDVAVDHAQVAHVGLDPRRREISTEVARLGKFHGRPLDCVTGWGSAAHTMRGALLVDGVFVLCGEKADAVPAATAVRQEHANVTGATVVITVSSQPIYDGSLLTTQ